MLLQFDRRRLVALTRALSLRQPERSAISLSQSRSVRRSRPWRFSFTSCSHPSANCPPPTPESILSSCPPYSPTVLLAHPAIKSSLRPRREPLEREAPLRPSLFDSRPFPVVRLGRPRNLKSRRRPFITRDHGRPLPSGRPTPLARPFDPLGRHHLPPAAALKI